MKYIKSISLRNAVASIGAAVTVASIVAAPVFAAPAAGGATPQQATPLSGTVRGSLAPGQVAWYQLYHDAKTNDALTLKTNPVVPLTQAGGNDGYSSGAFFNIEWTGNQSDGNFPGGTFNKDATGYWRVGQSTQAELDNGSDTLPAGTQYWQQNKSPNSNTFEIEVVNESSTPISYALTLDQSTAAVSATNNALPAPGP